MKTTRKKRKKSTSRRAPKKRLLEQVIQLTGIPSQAIRKELQTIMAKKNIKTDDITLDQLRSVAATYLREIMGGLLESTHLRRPDRMN
ncbi:MAG: hypothetical protein EBQ92_11440 [Proteobacteria bacterium]|nr:hypothetical protein [Pseudomonadota bacterium]